MTGVGLGPESSEALGVPGILGDPEVLRVAGVVELRSSFVMSGVASVELRSSCAMAGVATAGVATAWVLAEAQQLRSTNRSGGKPRGPMAEHNSQACELPGNDHSRAQDITGKGSRGRESLKEEVGPGARPVGIGLKLEDFARRRG